MFFSQEVKVDEIGKRGDKKAPEVVGGEYRYVYCSENPMRLARITYPVRIDLSWRDDSISFLFRKGEKFSSNVCYSSEMITPRIFRKKYQKAIEQSPSDSFIVLTPYHDQKRMIFDDRSVKFLGEISAFLSGELAILPSKIIIDKLSSSYFPGFTDICLHNYDLRISGIRVQTEYFGEVLLGFKYGPKHAPSDIHGFHPNGYDLIEFKGKEKLRISFERPSDWRPTSLT